jgi:hypothetical protein
MKSRVIVKTETIVNKEKNMRASLPLVIVLAVLLWTCEVTGNNADEANKTKAGVVTSSSRGLHGYISYSATRPSDRATYSAGMGLTVRAWVFMPRSGR